MRRPLRRITGISAHMFRFGMWRCSVRCRSPVRTRRSTARLRVRALGMPTATLWLVANGVFRGLGDTRTPLVWALLFSALNALLDPIFIFRFGIGIGGR